MTTGQKNYSFFEPNIKLNVNISTKFSKNIGIGRAISSGNLEDLGIIWQPIIKR